METGEKNIKNSLNRMIDSVKKFSAVLGAVFVAGKIAKLGKEALEAASDLEAVESQFSQVFGKLEKHASESLSKIAEQAGIMEERMKASYTKIAAFAKTTGMNTSDSLELANRAMAAVADSAAFYDRTLEETTESLQSFLKGNYENDAALGLSATETTRNAAANKLYGKSFIELSEAQKQLTLLTMVEDANKLSGALGQAARESDTWTNQIGNLNQAIANLKASIGKFFLPVAVQAVKIIVNIINAITAMISRLYAAASAIRSFSELLTGKESKNGTPIDASNQKMITGIGDSYNNAAEGAENLADANDEIAKSAKKANKALNNQLSSYDKINSLTKKADEGSGAGEDVDTGLGFADAEVIDDIDFGKIAEGEKQFEKLAKTFDAVIAKAKELGDLFKQGFFDGLGDWEYRWQIIKDSIASIKESLKNIFTDPAVLAAADEWAKSVAYLLGSIAGSMASIGLTIAANLLGGISKYLEQNTERIKEYLISMFNIWEEVNYMFSDLFQSIAFVFEAFASEQGQQLTANIIGIFTDAFMGITELASKIFRDIAQIIIKPFTENKEKFRTALEGFLGVLAEVTGTIKQGIDDTFDKINEVYDEHFKPFFDSVAQGFSDIVGHLLDFWNQNMLPILEDWAKKFDELWKNHIQPMLDNFIEMLGDVADFLKLLWENALKPLIDWIIDNVIPVILPIIDGIVKGVMDAAAGIADYIKGTIEVIRGIIQFLTGVFTGDWKKAWDGIIRIFEGIKERVKGIIDGILGFISDIIQGVKDAIAAITGLNKEKEVSYSGTRAQDFAAKNTSSPSRPNFRATSIPHLATGAVIPPNREFLAVLGDQKRGTNIETPLDTMIDAFKQALKEMNGGSEKIELTTMLDSDVLEKKMIEIDRKHRKRTGKPILT